MLPIILQRSSLAQPALNVPEPVREKLDSEESESVVSRIGTNRKSSDCFFIFELFFSWQQLRNGMSHFGLLSEPEPLAP